jgi:hypothetical protein
MEGCTDGFVVGTVDGMVDGDLVGTVVGDSVHTNCVGSVQVAPMATRQVFGATQSLPAAKTTVCSESSTIHCSHWSGLCK